MLLPVPRDRFAEFVLSPRRRMLLRGGRELPLIPRRWQRLFQLELDGPREREISTLILGEDGR